MTTDDELYQAISSREYSPKLQKQIDKLQAEEAKQKKRTWDHYEQLRKDNPSVYWKAKTQSQMHIDAVDLGEAFGMPDDD